MKDEDEILEPPQGIDPTTLWTTKGEGGSGWELVYVYKNPNRGFLVNRRERSGRDSAYFQIMSKEEVEEKFRPLTPKELQEYYRRVVGWRSIGPLYNPPTEK
jgi:hypothetical protein